MSSAFYRAHFFFYKFNVFIVTPSRSYLVNTFIKESQPVTFALAV